MVYCNGTPLFYYPHAMSIPTQAGPDAVAQIVDAIIETAGADSLPEEAKQPFRENLEAQVMRRLGIIIMQNLDDAGIAAYDELISERAKLKPEDMQAFLEQYMPDYETKIQAGMKEFLADVGSAIQGETAA